MRSSVINQLQHYQPRVTNVRWIILANDTSPYGDEPITVLMLIDIKTDVFLLTYTIILPKALTLY